MSATLVSRHAELYAALNGNITGVDSGAYYDHEPAPGDLNGNPAITVAWVGMSPEWWQYAVRLYVDPRPNAQLADTQIMTLVPLIEAAVGAVFGPSQWTREWNPDIARWVVTWLVLAGREDEPFQGWDD